MKYLNLLDTGKILPQINEEFPALIRGSKWGFFDLKESHNGDFLI